MSLLSAHIAERNAKIDVEEQERQRVAAKHHEEKGSEEGVRLTPTVVRRRRERSETFDVKPMELMFRSMVDPEDDEDPAGETVDFDSKFYYRRQEGQSAVEAEVVAQAYLQRSYVDGKASSARDPFPVTQSKLGGISQSVLSDSEKDGTPGGLTPTYGLVYGGNATVGAAGASRDQLVAMGRSRSGDSSHSTPPGPKYPPEPEPLHGGAAQRGYQQQRRYSQYVGSDVDRKSEHASLTIPSFGQIIGDPDGSPTSHDGDVGLQISPALPHVAGFTPPSGTTTTTTAGTATNAVTSAPSLARDQKPSALADNFLLRSIKDYLFGSEGQRSPGTYSRVSNGAWSVRKEERSPTRNSIVAREITGIDKDLFDSTGFYAGLEDSRSPHRGLEDSRTPHRDAGDSRGGGRRGRGHYYDDKVASLYGEGLRQRHVYHDREGERERGNELRDTLGEATSLLSGNGQYVDNGPTADSDEVDGGHSRATKPESGTTRGSRSNSGLSVESNSSGMSMSSTSAASSHGVGPSSAKGGTGISGKLKGTPSLVRVGSTSVSLNYLTALADSSAQNPS